MNKSITGEVSWTSSGTQVPNTTCVLRKEKEPTQPKAAYSQSLRVQTIDLSGG